MTIARLNPKLGVLRTDNFSNLLDWFFSETVNSGKLAGFNPRVDLAETEEGYIFEVALPGLNENQVHVDFQEGRLTISGERKFEREQNRQKYHLVETQYGAFSRTFYLPDTISPDKIEAHFGDGLLKIQVPKDEKKVRKHQISIKSTRGKSLQANGKATGTGYNKEIVNV
jgi:HSP20 family protein